MSFSSSFFVQRIARALAAIGLIFLCTVFLIFFQENLSSAVVALLYLVPVVISSAIWGRFAGISASVLSFFAFLYFFVPPYNTFRIAHIQDFLVMVIFLSVAVLISSLMARIQANLEAVQLREREAIQLYELSQELIGKNDETAIIQTLARHLAGFLTGAVIEVEAFPPGQPAIVRVPPGNGQLESNPSLERFPLASPRGRLGEIRIWDIPKDLPSEKNRQIQTIAIEGALALDRAILDANQTRAKVLEESDRLKTAILSSVSHELRTPLASIQASATSLFNPQVELEPEARIELQNLLLEETDRMAQLVGNLLNMSRIEAGALKLQRQWNSISEIVDTSARQLARTAHNHPIQVDVSEDLPLVFVDSVLMEQVMNNLIRNSLKYAPEFTPIKISAQTDDQFLHVMVRNSGPHIPEEYLEHVFEKFYPIPSADRVQGIGLGLSICESIVKVHDGRIWAENLPEGVAFHFTLPLSFNGVMPTFPDDEGI